MKKEKWILAGLAGAGIAALAYKLLSKSDIPEQAIFKPFDKHKYLGTWNELARMPSIIEKNFDEVVEDYSLEADGTLKVVTSVHHIKKDKWSDYTGKIKFAGDENNGRLKVSYFEPVYFAYNVLAVDEDYKYALVSTSNLNYLWVLSRDKSIPVDVRERFLRTAEGIGFDTNKLEWLV